MSTGQHKGEELAQDRADTFNRDYPVGSRVWVSPISPNLTGSPLPAEVTDEARAAGFLVRIRVRFFPDRAVDHLIDADRIIGLIENAIAPYSRMNISQSTFDLLLHLAEEAGRSMPLAAPINRLTDDRCLDEDIEVAGLLVERKIGGTRWPKGDIPMELLSAVDDLAGLRRRREEAARKRDPAARIRERIEELEGDAVQDSMDGRIDGLREALAIVEDARAILGI